MWRPASQRRRLPLAAVVLLGLSLTPQVAAQDANLCDVPGEEPDIIVGDIFDKNRWGSVGDITGFSIGTESCNIGTCWANWLANTPDHPLIAQNMYRLKDGRFEQIGQSWLKHGFGTFDFPLCSENCVVADGQHLGVNCSDPYESGLNGAQSGLGPKFEVNAATGVFPYPATDQSLTGNAIYKRLQVHDADLDPVLNADAQYFVEAQYVALDDATAGNLDNNVSYRRIFVFASDPSFDFGLLGATETETVALQAWADDDPEVALDLIPVHNDGRFVGGSKVTDLGNGVWRYEYALLNQNSHRAGQSFSVPVPQFASITNVGFHDVDYHSGEPFDGTDWEVTIEVVTGDTSITWSTEPFATNPNANALRWGTLYNFRFDVNAAPALNSKADVGLFRDGSPASVLWRGAVIPLVCGDGVCDDAEDCETCPDDCVGGGAIPTCCGDDTCEGEENVCNCVADCGGFAPVEAICDDGLDGDCDGLVDCDDPDCCPSGLCDGGFCCDVSEDCDDGLDCNGFESCVASVCTAGTELCPGGLCDDDLDMCVDCLTDGECSDGNPCNGVEVCSVGACGPGPPPVETICNDGLDLDCDGLTDCADPDCCLSGLCEGGFCCDVSADCDDGLDCNGLESCVASACTPGRELCPGSLCDDVLDVCVDCLTEADCDDGQFCNGAACSVGACVDGPDPCPGQQCDEVQDVCVNCLTGGDCDDGIFCNGVEMCDDEDCAVGVAACPGRGCDEVAQACVGNVALQPKMGEPLLGFNGEQLERFFAGRTAFDRVFSPAEGLGPIFNQNSCGSCHNTPAGGSGTVTVTRFGFVDEKSGGFDPLEGLGGSLLQSEAISAECAETIPPGANVTAQRLTNSTLGLGLVAAIPASTLQGIESSPPPGVSGRVHTVQVLEFPGFQTAGRFGWKSQLATGLSFSADAALNEMGITNRVVGNENAPNGDRVLLAQCDAVADPEDGPDGQGFDFIDRVTDFQRFLAAPPQTPRSGMTGTAFFISIGCAACHVTQLSTSSSAGLEEPLRSKFLSPYSDFLLHDMGGAADFIEQGDASGREMRTTPLWGIRVRDPLWHDGRILGGTFEQRIRAAIAEHDAVGSEARAAAQAFDALSEPDQLALVALMNSLGRAEFDMDGDGDVDADDYDEFLACFTGPGNFYASDDACSVADPNQDGDVDDDDFDLFVAAASGTAGAVPDGSTVPGIPLTVAPAGNDLVLSWGPSCGSGDIDYAIYEGPLGQFDAHAQRQCGTGGAISATFTPDAGNRYYLVVPLNGFREGSYGVDSTGAQRPRAASSCLPQSVLACE